MATRKRPTRAVHGAGTNDKHDAGALAALPRGGRQPPPQEVSERARTWADAHGTVGAAERLRVSKEALTRVIAGLPVLRGTIIAIQHALAEHDRAALRRGAV
jgi:hypothetical protein